MGISGAEVDRLMAGEGLSVESVWLAYLHEGGAVSCGQLDLFLDGALQLDGDQREILAKVLLRRLPRTRRGEPYPRRGGARTVDIDLTVAELTIESTAACPPMPIPDGAETAPLA